MRLNRPWMIHKWLPVTRAMPRMISELERQRDPGFLGGETWFGRTTIALQSWRSAEDLLRYATNPDLAHLPAWSAFRREVGSSGDVGIWHETYVISPGQHESVYHNMPAFGLGKVGSLIPATGAREHARGRFTAAG